MPAVNSITSIGGGSTLEAEVISRDGTKIAFTRVGAGPAVIIVAPALCHRAFGNGAKLASLLAAQYSVYYYDRRGRGASGDTLAYAITKEIDDLAALIEHAGGSAALFGESSGGALALEAARTLGDRVRAVAVYEVPFTIDSNAPSTASAWTQLRTQLSDGDRGAAVATFLRMVGTPGIVVAAMRLLPLWSKLTAVAPTLAYDGELVRHRQRGEPLSPPYWTKATCRVLVLAGDRSPFWIKSAAQALAQVLQRGVSKFLPGQTHNLKPLIVVPHLASFFSDSEAQRGSPGA